MLSEGDVVEQIQELLARGCDGSFFGELEQADIEPVKESENAGLTITLVDGTKFLVLVTKVEEGQ